MKLLTVLGARPQFIKAAPVSRVFATAGVQEIIVHTGQHYDSLMSQIFFDELGVPPPKYNLALGGLSHGAMTGRMIEKLEAVLNEEEPDWILVYGDTNSTLAGAIAASKLHIPIAHVEAGLRSFNRKMPEEINRVLADHLATLAFCPTAAAVQNLAREGIAQGVVHTGDVMCDAAMLFAPLARAHSRIHERLELKSGQYFLATLHRAENTDNRENLRSIARALSKLATDYEVVLPLHPRTRKMLAQFDCESLLARVRVIDPVSFLDMVRLEQEAKMILTDSGGVQKEAYFHGIPCITLRDETEWIETIDAGWNQLVGADTTAILNAVKTAMVGEPIHDYGDGTASAKVHKAIVDY